jgi:manganese oxidase
MRKVCLFGAMLVCCWALFILPAGAQSQAKVHTYYVAADEVEWNYAPHGIDKMMEMKFMGYSKLLTERGEHRIGTTYLKAVYREYTDETFTKLKQREPEWEHLGILGPVLRAEVGDTIKVIFKNNASHPYSMHPHGVFYKKFSEGSGYGRFRSVLGQAPTIPVPSYGYITRMPTSPKMLRAA